MTPESDRENLLFQISAVAIVTPLATVRMVSPDICILCLPQETSSSVALC
jgi:hypothetical protein